MSASSLLEQLSATGPALLPLLLDAAIKGLAILLLTALAILAMRRSSAAARHLVWFLGTASLLLLPFLSATLPGWYILPNWAITSPAAQPPATPSQPATPSPTAPLDAPDLPPILPAAPPETVIAPPTPSVAAPLTTTQSSPSLPWQAWVLAVWLGVSLLLVAHITLGFLSLWWLEHRASRLTQGDWPALLRQLCAQLGLSRPVDLLSSPRRTMPMTWGLWRTRLLMPADADTWPADERRTVLLHELAHAKRWDCLTQLVVQIVCALYWFNPLVWLAWRRMQTERERACDDLVLSTGAKPSAYAEQLLQIASDLPVTRFSAAAIAMARPSKLEGRLMAILDTTRNRRALTWGAVALAALLIAGLVVPLAMVRAQDGVTDTPLPTTQPSAQKVAERFLNALKERDTAAMGSLIAPEKPWELKRLPAMVRELRDKVYAADPQTLTKIIDRMEQDRYAAFRISGPRGRETHTLTVLTVKTDNGWRVGAIDDWVNDLPLAEALPLYVELFRGDLGQSVIAPAQTDWSAARDGVQMRLSAARLVWRADEVPKLKWAVRNVGTRQFVQLSDRQRDAQLEVDGVWYQWPAGLRGGALPELPPGKSLLDQAITMGPIWSRARAEDLEWSMNGPGWVSSEAGSSLILSPGKHTIRAAAVVRPSRVDTGDGFRVISPPLELVVEASPAGQASAWPPQPEVLTAAKEAILSAAGVLQTAARPEAPELKELMAAALAKAKHASELAKGSAVHTPALQLEAALGALQNALAADPLKTKAEFHAGRDAYGKLLDMISGENTATEAGSSTTRAGENGAAHVLNEGTQAATQPATPPAAGTAKAPILGPVVERAMQLNKPDVSQVFFLDLESGEVVASEAVNAPVAHPSFDGRFVSDALAREPRLAQRIWKSGADIAFVLHPENFGMKGLVKEGFVEGIDGLRKNPEAGTAAIRGLPESRRWEDIRIPQVNPDGWPAGMSGAHSLLVSGSGYFGAGYAEGCYWLHTAQGSLAVLQLGGLGDNVPAVTVRYSLVQSPLSAGSATQPAGLTAIEPAAIQAADWPPDPPFTELWQSHPRIVDLGGLARQEAWQRLVENVKRDAAQQWPEAEVREKNDHLSVLYHVSEQDVVRPASKAGGTVQRRELGPESDGFLLEMRFEDQPGQADRPQTLSREPWRTFLGEVRLTQPDTLLMVNVSYGRATNRRKLEQFVQPARWVRTEGPATSPATRPVQPTWHQFQELLGQPIDSPAVLDFASRYRLEKYTKFDEGGFENYSAQPFSLLYRQDRISRVFVQIAPHPEFRQAGIYAGLLPHGITARDTPEHVILRMDSPTTQLEPATCAMRRRGSRSCSTDKPTV